MSSTAEPGGAPTYTGAPPQGYAAPAGRNGLGTAALVLGILALITSWTVIGGILLGVLAVVFGAVGRGRVSRGEATNRGAAIAGLVLGLLGIVVAVFLLVVGATFFAHHKTQLQQLHDCLQGAHTQAQTNACNAQLRHSLTHNG